MNAWQFAVKLSVVWISFSSHIQAQVEPPKKFAGDLFVEAVGDGAPEQIFEGLQKPHVQWIVRLKENAAIPENLQGLVDAGVSFAPSEFKRRVVLQKPSLTDLQNANESTNIEHLEMLPPQGLGPSLGGFVPFNKPAAFSHNVPTFRTTFGVTGKAMTIGLFDEGRVRDSHQEFISAGSSRVMNIEPSAVPISLHSTHVCGTIGASGSHREEAGGMAPNIRVRSYTWNNDLDVLENDSNQFKISNHSYGPLAGWAFDPQFGWIWYGRPDLGANSTKEDAQFGKYGDRNNQLDDLLVRKPNLAVFAAAGNDRNNAPPFQPIVHWALRKTSSGTLAFQNISDQHFPDGFDNGGFDTIAGLGLSKNVICIGAVNDIPTASTTITSTAFSSWGPTDDGRIKPDLVCNGQQLFSTGIADDQAYDSLSGTSMATPVASACGALMAEYFSIKKSREIKATELKAVLIHSARDAGQNGPDYVFGWGSIDLLAAGRIVEGNDGQQIATHTITAGNTLDIPLKTSPSSSPIKVTAVWADPAANPNVGNLDDQRATLQNNVDVELVSPSGTVFLPYILDPANPTTLATRGKNVRDNVEVIEATHQLGTWKLRINGATFSTGTDQEVALVISGLVP